MDIAHTHTCPSCRQVFAAGTVHVCPGRDRTRLAEPPGMRWWRNVRGELLAVLFELFCVAVTLLMVLGGFRILFYLFTGR